MEQMKKQIEYRSADLLTVDEENSMLVTGYAAMIGQPATIFSDENGVDYKEVIDLGAFDSADMSDVVFRYNHSDESYLLARTKNQTLVLTVDEKGLNIKATLANTSGGRDLYELIKRGDISKMSFGFTVSADRYDIDTHTRHILKIDSVIDVSAVDFPAYDSTSLNIVKRSFADAQKEAAEKTMALNARKRLFLLTMC